MATGSDVANEWRFDSSLTTTSRPRSIQKRFQSYIYGFAFSLRMRPSNIMILSHKIILYVRKITA